VPVEAKLLLTLQEAQALTGLSRDTLRHAIDDGTLKAQVIGRGFKIKRADLDEYVAKL
jgi:excisionase family DNA binding protein